MKVMTTRCEYMLADYAEYDKVRAHGIVESTARVVSAKLGVAYGFTIELRVSLIQDPGA